MTSVGPEGVQEKDLFGSGSRKEDLTNGVVYHSVSGGVGEKRRISPMLKTLHVDGMAWMDPHFCFLHGIIRSFIMGIC